MSSTVVDDSVDPATLTSALLDAEAQRAPVEPVREVVELPDDALPGVGGEGLGLRASVASGGAGLPVVVEHDIPLVMSMSDRVQYLSAGTTLTVGTPEQVRVDPAVVASYLGTDERAIARSGRLG